MKALFSLLLSFAFLLPTQAQTTLSFTSRGDLASSFGSATRDNERIGTRSSFGFELAKHTKENQAFLTGIEYAIGGTDYEGLIYVIIDNSNPLLSGTDSLAFSGAFRYDFIALPLGYRLYGKQKKWRFYGQASLIPMAYLRTIASQRIEGEDRVTQRLRDLAIRDVHLAASAGAGIERVFDNGWAIGIQPTARVHLNSISNGPLKERLWTGGMQLNIGRQLSGLKDKRSSDTPDDL